MIKHKSAGGLVINNGQIAVVSQNGNSWSLPKGHLDEGEDELTAAKREIREECGITDLKLIKKLGTYKRYRIGKDGKGEDKTDEKIITIFLFLTSQESLQPEDPENPEAVWLEPKVAVNLLTHPKDKEFLQSQLGEIEKLWIAESIYLSYNHPCKKTNLR